MATEGLVGSEKNNTEASFPKSFENKEEEKKCKQLEVLGSYNF